jgi:hypothetical protein
MRCRLFRMPSSRLFIAAIGLAAGVAGVFAAPPPGSVVSATVTRVGSDFQISWTTTGEVQTVRIDQPRTLPIKQLPRLNGSTGSIRSRRSRRRHSGLHPIFMTFRGLQAQG